MLTLYPAIVIVTLRNVLRLADLEQSKKEMSEQQWQSLTLMQIFCVFCSMFLNFLSFSRNVKTNLLFMLTIINGFFIANSFLLNKNNYDKMFENSSPLIWVFLNCICILVGFMFNKINNYIN